VFVPYRPIGPLGSRELGVSRSSVAGPYELLPGVSRIVPSPYLSAWDGSFAAARASTKPAGVQFRAQPAHLPRSEHA
jgi:hypothetical protein